MKDAPNDPLAVFLKELRVMQVRGERNGSRETSDLLLHVLSAGRGDWQPLKECLGIL